ncbi:hypothetical protein DNTS_031732 [Danionella cerebrum]|uniref:Uncharacterized protein n=1 Tax=Danionella cerebrum TaxID=2873325 RepID=A0A553QBA7_9TELE|nr:hypothetical protein DNTS_031732 [Danionella translucida]
MLRGEKVKGRVCLEGSFLPNEQTSGRWFTAKEKEEEEVNLIQLLDNRMKTLGCTSEMEQSIWFPEGEVEELSGRFEGLLVVEEPEGPDSASSSCSDLSITTPAVQPCPNNSKSFPGLRIFGRRW